LRGGSSRVRFKPAQGVTEVSRRKVSGESKYRDPRADALRSRYHELYGGGKLPVPVEAIAEDMLGLSVREVPIEGVSGLLYPAERVVYVNANDTPARRRFTLAHEVGHWICQCLEGRGVPTMCRAEDVAPGTDRTLEREANIFAAELLMPEPAVRLAAGDPAAADRFGVSSEAMRWRLYAFGLAEAPK
jgi:IrrE N-terminal-like domain